MTNYYDDLAEKLQAPRNVVKAICMKVSYDVPLDTGELKILTQAGMTVDDLLKSMAAQDANHAGKSA